MKYVFSLLLLACLALVMGGCDPVSTSQTMPPGTPTMGSTPGPTATVTGTRENPAVVEDTIPGTCMTWHISIDQAKSVAWCAANMPGHKVGDYIQLSANANGTLQNEYQITAMDPVHLRVSVRFVQPWTPPGSLQNPYILVVYQGHCTSWRVTFEGVAMDPLCTDSMPIHQFPVYVRLTGAGQHGEFAMITIDYTAKQLVIGALQ
jgi:hypothetical protein